MTSTYEQAESLALQHHDVFYAAAFFFPLWLRDLLERAITQYAEHKNPKDRSLQRGEAWRARTITPRIMSAPLSDYWVIEYQFTSTAFSVSPLRDYLTLTQRAFTEGRFCDNVILAVHPTREGASDECHVWQERRNQSPVSVEERLKQLRRYVEGLESQLDSE
jgi:hypothetical protein